MIIITVIFPPILYWCKVNYHAIENQSVCASVSPELCLNSINRVTQTHPLQSGVTKKSGRAGGQQRIQLFPFPPHPLLPIRNVTLFLLYPVLSTPTFLAF